MQSSLDFAAAMSLATDDKQCIWGSCQFVRHGDLLLLRSGVGTSNRKGKDCTGADKSMRIGESVGSNPLRIAYIRGMHVFF